MLPRFFTTALPAQAVELGLLGALVSLAGGVALFSLTF